MGRGFRRSIQRGRADHEEQRSPAREERDRGPHDDVRQHEQDRRSIRAPESERSFEHGFAMRIDLPVVAVAGHVVCERGHTSGTASEGSPASARSQIAASGRGTFMSRSVTCGSASGMPIREQQKQNRSKSIHVRPLVDVSARSTRLLRRHEPHGPNDCSRSCFHRQQGCGRRLWTATVDCDC